MAEPKKILLPLLVVGLGLLAAVVLVASRPEVEKSQPEIVPPNVRVLEARPQTVAVTIESQGTVMPRTEANLVAEVAGRVIRVGSNFESGGFVRLGQPLVWLDRRDYEAALSAQEASLAQARVALQREQAEADIARDEWQSLGRDGDPNPLVLRQPQLREAEARVAAAEAAVQRAQLDLERTIIRAPFTGRVRGTAIDRGGFVNRGTPLATVYSVDTVEVRLPVKDSELAFLAAGTNIDAGAEGGAPVMLSAQFAGAEREWRGRVVRTEGEIDPQTRMVHLIASVDDPYGLERDLDAPLGIGLFVDAAVEGVAIEDAFLIPRSAVQRDGAIYVVEDERLRRREVNIRRSTSDALIIDLGLAAGDQVVVSKLDIVTEGMTVNALPQADGERFRSDTEAPRLQPTGEASPAAIVLEDRETDQ